MRELLFVVGALAIWRLILLLTVDEGPFSAFKKMRAGLNTSTWVGRGLRCENCLSFWFGLFVAMWLWYFGVVAVWEFPLWWLGLSGGALFIDYMAKR
jgi:hypothetical protein